MQSTWGKTMTRWAVTLITLLSLLALAGGAMAAVDDTPPDKFIMKIKQPWTGDLPDMEKRRTIRALVTYNKTHYFLDGARERGLTYEAMRMYEKFLNQQLAKQGKKKKHLKVHIILIPVARDKLLSYLVQGKGDIAAANLTVTSKRLKQVDFCAPFSNEVNEVVVTGPGAPVLKNLDDLSGKTVYVRRSSSYFENLTKLNRQFKKKGLKPVKIELADENLETEDILEMANAGLVPITVADSHLAVFWSNIFKKIKVHDKLALAKGGKIAWAVRKGSPKLMKSINAFVKKNKQGTLMGNILIKRYLESTKWAKNALTPENIERFDRTPVSPLRLPFASGLTLLGAHESESTRYAYSDLAEALRLHGSQPRLDMAELFRRMVFNILVLNDDDHLRNHGFIHDGAGWRLSPLYDVVPKPQVGLDRRLVLGVGLEGRTATLDNALSNATAFGLSTEEAGAIIETLRATVNGAWREAFTAAGLGPDLQARFATCFRQALPASERDAAE
ncbi:MAG: HipA domain-containing protein [Proteobacteria bacterium]|nr:HipA domain-containing protein [Pseudomonadota bacterium]